MGSVPEVIDDGVTGFIVDNMDDAVKATGRAAELDRFLIRRVFERRFSARRMAEDYLRIYRTLTNSDPDIEFGKLLTSAA